MARLEWEDMTDNHKELQRIAVPGGWLVRTSIDNEKTSICFYPDPQHLWECDG